MSATSARSDGGGTSGGTFLQQDRTLLFVFGFAREVFDKTIFLPESTQNIDVQLWRLTEVASRKHIIF